MTDILLFGFWFAFFILVACSPAILLRLLADWQAWRNLRRRERMR